MSKYAGDFKMVLLGHTDVGKSSLVLRFVKGQYVEYAECTIGAAYLKHKIEIDANTVLEVALWDTAGQERYHSLAPIYYRGAQAALIVYDITNSDTFTKAKQWVRELREVNGNEMVIGLVGNKTDLAAMENQRQVNSRDAAIYADENNLIFMETSAKLDTNVKQIFTTVAEQVAAKQLATIVYKPSGTLPLRKTNTNQKTPCCKNS